MTKYECNSRLGLKPSLEERTLEIKLRHAYHTPCKDIRMGPDALAFVKKYVPAQTPSEIYVVISE